MSTTFDTPLVIHNVHLPTESPTSPFTLTIQNGHITSIVPAANEPTEVPWAANFNGNNGLVLPSLCHPHIHLDKPYLLRNRPPLETGDFNEAMKLSNQARGEYTAEDLLERGRRLILESVQAGVTAMRAHVEVDMVVGTKCLEVALKLKEEFGDEGRGVCDIQVAVFSQNSVFTGKSGGQALRKKFYKACGLSAVDAVGTMPCIEATVELQKRNVEWIVDIAMLHRKHLDIHLDHNLDPNTEPLIHHLIQTVQSRGWSSVIPKHVKITLGHCTRLSLYPPYALTNLHSEIARNELPIYFIGLPTSDLYMIGRDVSKENGGAGAGGGMTPRGTIQVLEWIKKYGLEVSLGVDNVGDAFTPWGGVDPLQLVPLGVGLYQGGTKEDCRILLECVTTRAKQAIGMMRSRDASAEDTGYSLKVCVGDKADLVIVAGNGKVFETALNPGYERVVIKNGKIIARRVVSSCIA